MSRQRRAASRPSCGVELRPACTMLPEAAAALRDGSDTVQTLLIVELALCARTVSSRDVNVSLKLMLQHANVHMGGNMTIRRNPRQMPVPWELTRHVCLQLNVPMLVQ